MMLKATVLVTQADGTASVSAGVIGEPWDVHQKSIFAKKSRVC